MQRVRWRIRDRAREETAGVSLHLLGDDSRSERRNYAETFFSVCSESQTIPSQPRTKADVAFIRRDENKLVTFSREICSRIYYRRGWYERGCWRLITYGHCSFKLAKEFTPPYTHAASIRNSAEYRARPALINQVRNETASRARERRLSVSDSNWSAWLGWLQNTPRGILREWNTALFPFHDADIQVGLNTKKT